VISKRIKRSDKKLLLRYVLDNEYKIKYQHIAQKLCV